MADLEIRVTEQDRYTEHQLMLAEQAVSGLAIVNLVMRVGVTAVHMGGIAGVWTDKNHRYKGYARRVLEHSNRWMAEHEYDCATLFGIDDFYDKFGYAVCLPDCRVEVRTREAERASGTLAVRPFTPEDLPAVRELYASNNADLTGSIVRDETSSWLQKGSGYGVPVEVFVFTGGTDEIVAYAARDNTDEKVVVTEAGARHPRYYADIVRWAAERAVALRVETIAFLIPPDSLLAAHLTLYGASQRLSFPRNGGGMGRILRLHDFFRKTLPEWTRRASAVPSLSAGTALRLETDIGDLTLRWTGSAVELETTTQASGTVCLPQSRLMQLAMGYYSAALALSLSEMEAHGDLGLFHALFPRLLAYMWRADHF